MKYFPKNTLLALPVLLLSTTAFSSGYIPGTGGVVVDVPSLAPSPAKAKPAAIAGVVVPIPTEVTEIDTPAKLPRPVTLVEAAAEDEQVGDAAFKAIVKAMTPSEPVEPLIGKQFTVYLSEKVAFAKLEQDASRFKVNNGRVHLAGLYSEERDSVFQAGLAVDASLANSIRMSFGTRAYLALLNAENTDTFSGAFGVEAAYNLPFKALPLEFAASLYYAPDILTFGASDRTIDAQIDFAFPLRAKSSIFAGLRFLQFDVRPEDSEVDNRLHIGFRQDFM